jgi:hypothetical protein
MTKWVPSRFVGTFGTYYREEDADTTYFADFTEALLHYGRIDHFALRKGDELIIRPLDVRCTVDRHAAPIQFTFTRFFV